MATGYLSMGDPDQPPALLGTWLFSLSSLTFDPLSRLLSVLKKFVIGFRAGTSKSGPHSAFVLVISAFSSSHP
jgi:hypothetical protein